MQHQRFIVTFYIFITFTFCSCANRSSRKRISKNLKQKETPEQFAEFIRQHKEELRNDLADLGGPAQVSTSTINSEEAGKSFSEKLNKSLTIVKAVMSVFVLLGGMSALTSINQQRYFHMCNRVLLLSVGQAVLTTFQSVSTTAPSIKVLGLTKVKEEINYFLKGSLGQHLFYCTILLLWVNGGCLYEEWLSRKIMKLSILGPAILRGWLHLVFTTASLGPLGESTAMKSTLARVVSKIMQVSLVFDLITAAAIAADVTQTLSGFALGSSSVKKIKALNVVKSLAIGKLYWNYLTLKLKKKEL